MKFGLNRRNLAIGIVGGLLLIAAACGSGSENAAPTAIGGATSTVGANGAVSNGDGDAQQGQRLFRSEGCSACHRTSSQRLVGPGLAGIASRADDAYIRQSIVDPDAVVVEGFNNVMTDFSDLGDEKVNDLVAYLKTLE